MEVTMACQVVWRMTIAGCLLFLSIHQVSANQSGVQNEWKQTDLDFTFISQNVTSKACAVSEDAFLACVNAIQAMLDLSKRGLALQHACSPEPKGGRRMSTRFGSLALILDRDNKETAGHGVIQTVKAAQQRNVDWRKLFNCKQSTRADFDKLLTWVSANVIESGRTGAYAAVAINAYIGVGDVHARIFPAAAGPNSSQVGSGDESNERGGISYTGIGIAIQRVTDAMLITSVFKDSPASKVDLRAGDVIVAVNGKPIGDNPVAEVVSKLRGAAGSKVHVAIKRPDTIRDVDVIRADVVVRNVSSSIMKQGKHRWGHIYIRGFVMGNTCPQVRRELHGLVQQDIDGLILDVRDNLGGRIDQAVCVADLFLEPGLPVVEIRNLDNQERTQRQHTRWPATTQLPMVSLVNAATGSASEVLVGALRDHGRAPVVGERTFGKATMQRMHPWEGSDSVMQFRTVARMYSPSGHTAQMVGIAPDIKAAAPGQGQVLLRQADLFPNALPADDSTDATNNDHQFAGLQLCVASRGKAEERVGVDESNDSLPDYPINTAQDTLGCLISRSSHRGERLSQYVPVDH
ncbi:MAG: PDZ domain-containing protein [Halobacteria archaeon]|nr:PDZ domain-containing protein [Halobacteria archaeon]